MALLLWGIYELQTVTNPVVYVSWDNPNKIQLDAGEAPVAFWYNKPERLLVHRGQIDIATKKQLSKLAANDQSYQRAIGKLTFDSSAKSSRVFFWILVVGGLGGVLGVQVRSLFDFIGHTCYKGSLDINLWWPWYVLRPVLGFLLGFLVLGLVQGEILQVGEGRGTNIYWWIGLAILAGFGASDVIAKLRLVSKTLFGSDSREGKS